jgi:UDP-glucose 4-epimerase
MHGISEDHPPLPTSPYSSAKLAAEQLLTYHAATGAVGAAILRCFNSAGAVDGVRRQHSHPRISPMSPT